MCFYSILKNDLWSSGVPWTHYSLVSSTSAILTDNIRARSNSNQRGNQEGKFSQNLRAASNAWSRSAIGLTRREVLENSTMVHSHSV